MKNFKLKGLKYNKGIYEFYNDRYIFFPPKIIEILSSIYGEGVKSLLVWLGKKAGWNLIQNWEENLKPKNLTDLVELFSELISIQGWGELTPREINEELITIELKHNISSELESNSKHICYFINGLLSGFGEFALYKVKTTETECCFDNKELDSCIFTIKKVK
ncbi:MAG: hypothetical protein GF317_01385 [Candidatus Lokiarchaeota archaeon]|nr:hypothetical protein [Candidatus Lokiarchaeota archaeon]MBD3198597.1 hypothetical protein [Candidatus Lokiarchaeota archaeon]